MEESRYITIGREFHPGGSLTPTLPIISHKANNGFIFLSISHLSIARSTIIRYNSNEVII